MNTASDKQSPDRNGVPHPREVSELVGHAQAQATLRHAWDSGRLPHAWLLSGARGIGKASLAYRFASFVLSDPPPAVQALFTDTPQGILPPPGASAPHYVALGTHPDLFVLEPGKRNRETNRISKDIVVSQVREATHFCHMTPALATWRIVLIDPAEEMTQSAANALLKILEEPPRQALILLVTHNPARLLSTIRSRCAQLALANLETDVVEERLRAFDGDLDGDDASAIARLAEGSIARALELSDAGGIDLYRRMIGVLDQMPATDPASLHEFADRVSQGGEGGSFRLGGELFAWWIGRLARAGATGRMPMEVVRGEANVIERLLGLAPLEDWLDLWEKTIRLFRQAEERHFDRRQVVLSLFLDIEAMAA